MIYLNLNVTNSSKTNIDFNGTDNVVINNVTSTGAVAGNALSITDGQNYSISNFTSSGNAWGGIALYTSTYFPPAGVNNVTIGSGISISDSPRMYSEVKVIGDPITNINYSTSLFRYTVTNPALPKYKWYAYASDYSSITSIPGNVVYDNILGYFVYPAPLAPTTLGINVHSLSATPSQTPVSVACGAFTNDNTPAQVWTSVTGSNILYQRQAQAPGGGWWTDPEIFSSTSTDYLFFMNVGQGNGLDGAWKLRVRAFEDNNSNNTLDSADSVSAWSNDCVINYDDTKPSIPNIISPLESSAFNTTPILNDWTDSTDVNGVAKYIIEYQYDDGHTFPGGPYRESTVSQRNHTPALYEEGGVKFRVKAVDNLGNVGDWSDWRHYYYDITESSSSFITPINDSKYNLPINITGLTVDNVGVEKVSLYFKNSTDSDIPANWTFITDLSNSALNSPFNWEYNWTPTIDGKYDIKVNGVDTAGNVENTGYAYNILYDTTDPVVDITSHVNGDMIKGNVSIQGTLNDTNLLRYYFVIQNSSNVTVAGPGTVYDAGPLVNVSLNWNTASVPDGTYSIRLEARDTANNKGAASVEVVSVIVDNSSPSTPKFLNTPFATHNGDMTYSGGNVRNEVSFTQSTDLTGIAKYEYQFVRLDLNGVKLQDGLVNMNTYLGGVTCASSVCTWKPDYQNNNQWVFRMRAVDNVGNISAWSNWNDANDSQFYSFSTTYNQVLANTGIFARSDFDNTSGNRGYAVREDTKPSSEITSPTGVLSTNNPNITINYTANDAQTAIKNVKLYNDTGDLLATSTTGQFNITLDEVDSTTCLYTRAEDVTDDKVLDAGVGNIEDIDNDCELEVRLDVTSPTIGNISFLMDFNPYVFGNGFMVSAPVSDSFSGVDGDTCEFTFDGGTTWLPGAYSSGNCMTFKSTPDNTILTVIAKVVDNVGNTGTGAPKIRTSDSQDPEVIVDIADLYYGPNQYPVNTIKGSASDSTSDIETLQITIRRSGDNKYWSGSTFNCMFCFLPQPRNISLSTLPNWVYNSLPGTSLTNGKTYVLTPMAMDSVMHMEIGTSDAFIWDSTAPTNPTTVNSSHNPYNNISNIIVDWPAVGVAGGANDTLSGVAGFSYIWSQNSTDTVDQVMDTDFNTTSLNSGNMVDGQWYLHIKTVDNVQNWSGVSSFGPYTIDTVDPVTTASGIDSDWHNTSVNVTLTCTDTDGSGCFKTFYSINGGSFVEGNVAVITTEGYNQISYYSVDNAGNTEETTSHVQTINIDLTDPNNPTDFTSDPEINVSSQDSTVEVSWNSESLPTGIVSLSVLGDAYDNLSGLKQFQYKFTTNASDTVIDTDAATTNNEVTSDPLADGLWYFHIRTEDNAGNKSDTTSYGPFIIDNTKPVITRIGGNVTITQGDTYNDQGATALDIQDGNLTSNIVTLNPVNINVAGTYTITYNVSDSAGNNADQVTRTVTVLPAPVVPVNVVEPEVLGEDDQNLEEEGETDQENGEVLGLTCSVKQFVSGYVYDDKNNNGTKDENELGIEGVELNIVYTDTDGKEVVLTVKTNSDGKWESELCPAGYKVTVKSETLPEGYKLSSEDVLGLTVNADNEIENFNIAVQTEKENSNWNWLWILLLVLILGSFGLYYYRSRRRN